ncbi:hypothetical protein [Seonamhaeicola marinus]|uniref:Uncharacterized protein n=1 Tax=Seonamhaeicola marinus TaxID=1912246 RepID=A0A5D0IMV4_9FLAO|nr:hypothetical protein [Seonamhaeicola marinus]TYA84359.1 hypothetical protein FUA24_06860 [Seonamhaeicola marinus]
MKPKAISQIKSMTSIFKLLALTLTVVLFNCKNETIDMEYKFSNMPEAVTCEVTNKKLYQEALYSFEMDILNFYGKNNRNENALPNLTYAYNLFVRNAIYSRVPYESVVSQHSLEVFKALKNDNTLWDAENTKSHLNYDSDVISCIAKNIKNENLNTSFNALLSIDDLSPKLFGAPLASNSKNALSDKHLATYIALDLYYSKLFDVDLTTIAPKAQEPKMEKVDFNKVPKNNSSS